MKQLSYFTFLLVFAFAISACQGDQSTSNTATDAASTAAPAMTPPPVTAGAVDHYTCPNGHAGAPAAGNCTQCGTALVHNQAFHANDQIAPPANSNPMQQFAPAAAGANSTTTTTTANPAAASPAQNAAGVFHYTCSAGCAGGAGAAGTCASCGGALAHNQAYHN